MRDIEFSAATVCVSVKYTRRMKKWRGQSTLYRVARFGDKCEKVGLNITSSVFSSSAHFRGVNVRDIAPLISFANTN